jgi:hypothetical protein
LYIASKHRIKNTRGVIPIIEPSNILFKDSRVQLLSNIDSYVFPNDTKQELLAESSHKTCQTAYEHGETPSIGLASQFIFVPGDEQCEKHLCDKKTENWENTTLDH